MIGSGFVIKKARNQTEIVFVIDFIDIFLLIDTELLLSVHCNMFNYYAAFSIKIRLNTSGRSA